MSEIVPTSPIYAPSLPDLPIRQGEILSDLVKFSLGITGLDSIPAKDEPAPVVRTEHPLAIVISQDCDLDWDFKDRFAQHDTARPWGAAKELPAVLLCEINTAAEIRNNPGMNSSIWGRIKINKDERYQFLEQVPPECDALALGLPEMAVDFKRCFSIPTDELYLQVKCQAKRRCRLVSPYLEHFQQRVFYFHSRIGLPADHQSEPEGR